MNSLQLAVTRCNVVKHGTISSEPEVTCQGLGCRKWDRVKLPDTRRSRKKQIGKKKKARGAGLLKHPIQIVDQDGNYRVFFFVSGFHLVVCCWQHFQTWLAFTGSDSLAFTDCTLLSWVRLRKSLYGIVLWFRGTGRHGYWVLYRILRFCPLFLLCFVFFATALNWKFL